MPGFIYSQKEMLASYLRFCKIKIILTVHYPTV